MLPSNLMKYTVCDLFCDFGDEKSCLIWLFEYIHPNGFTCTNCNIITKHYPISGRKVFSCGRCGHQVSPMVGTIFQNSHVHLISWFYAIYQMATNKAGTSAKQIQRESGVSYKTAWRMMHRVRTMMVAPAGQLSGEVEIDETYVHANVYKRSSAQRRYGYIQGGRRTGEILFGAVERGGRVKIFHVRGAGERVLTPITEEHVQTRSLIHSDGYSAYKKLDVWGYEHRTTNHSAMEFYREDSYTQNIENVWSHLKRGIKGVYRHVEPKYLQAYADEYAWRYSNRNKPSMFWSLMIRVV